MHNNLMESLLSILLAPVNMTCNVISSITKFTSDIFLGREYDHKETIRRRGSQYTEKNSNAQLWNYVFYMIDQANATGRRIRYVFLEIAIYASPSNDKNGDAHRIVQKFYADSKKRKEKIKIQQHVVNFFFPRPKQHPNSTSTYHAVRQFERLMWPTPISGWGFP